MSEVPTAAEIEALRDIDTPTICNLLEMVVPERRGYGYTPEELAVALQEVATDLAAEGGLDQ